MGGPSLIPPRLVVAPRLPLKKRQLSDKLQELSLRSPEYVRDLESLVDFALMRLDGREFPSRKR